MKLFGKKRPVQQAQHSVSERTVDPLLTLSHGDQELSDAMSFLLFVRPREQASQLGTTEELLQRAKEEAGKGELTKARIDLETAARIEMYKGDTEKVRMLLNKALEIHDQAAQKREQAVLSNLDKAMMIAMEYYHQSSP